MHPANGGMGKSLSLRCAAAHGARTGTWRTCSPALSGYLCVHTGVSSGMETRSCTHKAGTLGSHWGFFQLGFYLENSLSKKQREAADCGATNQPQSNGCSLHLVLDEDVAEGFPREEPVSESVWKNGFSTCPVPVGIALIFHGITAFQFLSYPFSPGSTWEGRKPRL